MPRKPKVSEEVEGRKIEDGREIWERRRRKK
jgi:hypothetical protein